MRGRSQPVLLLVVCACVWLPGCATQPEEAAPAQTQDEVATATPDPDPPVSPAATEPPPPASQTVPPAEPDDQVAQQTDSPPPKEDQPPAPQAAAPPPPEPEPDPVAAEPEVTPPAEQSAPSVVDPGGPIAVAATKPGLTRIGAAKCKICHKVQFASWEESAHATRTPPLDCEDCHGPGSEYKSKKVMEDPEQALAAGLVRPDRSFCSQCHTTGWTDELLERAHAHKADDS